MPLVLSFKQRFLTKDHPDRVTMERFSAKLRKMGLREATIGYGPSKEKWEEWNRDPESRPAKSRSGKNPPAEDYHGSVTVTLPPALNQLVERLVHTGRYADEGDVVREALRARSLA